MTQACTRVPSLPLLLPQDTVPQGSLDAFLPSLGVTQACTRVPSLPLLLPQETVPQGSLDVFLLSLG